MQRMDVQHGFRAAVCAQMRAQAHPVRMRPGLLLAAYAILPPTPRAVSHENLVVVDRDVLLRTYLDGGVTQYVAALAELRA